MSNVPPFGGQSPQSGSYPAPSGASLASLASAFKTNRSLAKYILVGIVTLGIYCIVVLNEIANTTNVIAQRDGKKTGNAWVMVLVLSWLTLGIYPLVWYHGLSNRVGDDLQRRGQPRLVSASDFWLWNVLGALIVVGPFIYIYKLLNAMNVLSRTANEQGL